MPDTQAEPVPEIQLVPGRDGREGGEGGNADLRFSEQPPLTREEKSSGGEGLQVKLARGSARVVTQLPVACVPLQARSVKLAPSSASVVAGVV